MNKNNIIPFTNKFQLLKFYNLSNSRLQLIELLKNENIPSSILNAFVKIPREFFLPYDKVDFAYQNKPIPIGFQQTISQPSLVCKMIHKLELKPTYNVLEIGTGIGYNASLLSLLSKNITTVEILPELVKRAKARIVFCKEQGIIKDNISLILGDGNLGYYPNSPYDRIIVTCGSFEIPEKLIEQLKEGGIIIMPIKEKLKNGAISEYIYIVKKINGKIYIKKDEPVRFVPFIKKNIKSKKII